MIRYTGHPFVDVGVSVIENYIEKPCEDLAGDDLEKAANWLRGIYSRKDMKGYLTVHFPNSGWCNATISDENKDIYISKVLRSYTAEPLKPDRTCAFCEHPAQFLADRQHIPMLTGTTLLVTAPYGVVGLPVCGYCLYSVQFYPLATLKVEGKPLFWWTPNPDMTFQLVREMHSKVMQLLAGSTDKFPNLDWPRTRLLETARKVVECYNENENLADCIGYHVTNYGSGPDFREYIVPKALLDFWQELRFANKEVREAHAWIEESQWEKPKVRKANKTLESNDTGNLGNDSVGSRRNFYYEGLSRAFESKDWVHELRLIVSRYYVIFNKEHINKNCYELAKLFLRKVGGMDKQRIDVIKNIADQITNVLILGNNEKRWFTELYMKEKRTGDFLKFLVKAQKRLSELGQPIALEDVLIMLDLSSTDDVGPKDTWLVRDLFLLRMLEHLGKNNQEILKEVELETEEQA